MKTECIPIMEGSNITYSNNQENGTRVYKVLNHAMNQPLIFNKTAVDIIDGINGIKSIEDLYNEQCRKYPKIEKLKLENDLYKLLYELWHLSMIKWKDNRHPFEKLRCNYSGYVFEWVHENEIISNYDTSKFFKHTYFTPMYEEKMIMNPTFISENSYNYLVGNFNLKNKDNLILDLLIIARPHSNSADIYYMNLNDDLKANVISNFLRWCVNSLEEYIPINIKRLDLYMTEDQLSLLSPFGIKYEVVNLHNYFRMDNSNLDGYISSYLIS